MPQRTFTFELRTHFSGAEADEKDKIVEQTVRMAAKHAYTTALLLADDAASRKPEAALSSGDMFEGVREISLADDIEPVEDTKKRLGLDAPNDTSEVTTEGNP